MCFANRRLSRPKYFAFKNSEVTLTYCLILLTQEVGKGSFNVVHQSPLITVKVNINIYN